MNIDISLGDLIIAYRKVKSDLYFDEGTATLIQLAEYEENLHENLKRLKSRLRENDSEWFIHREFIGTFRYVLKEMKSTPTKGLYASNTLEDWEHRTVNPKDVDFRFIGQHSIDFHIVTSLWIDKIGYKLEERLSEKCYGCRLRRTNQAYNQFVKPEYSGSAVKENERLSGHFRPYHWDYKRWQNDGFKAIHSAISDDKKVIVLTADLKKFYPSITANFLLDSRFYEFIGKTEFTGQEPLTQLIVEILNRWSISCRQEVFSAIRVNEKHCGIPIGTSISKVIANLFLAYWDYRIEREIAPLHYGRYVDDIIIVIDNQARIKTAPELWSYLSSRIPELQIISPANNREAKFKLPFGDQCEVEFGVEKERIFLLEGQSGETFIDTVKESLEETSSEWRLLPDAEADLDTLSKEFTSGSSDSEKPANNLRKSDGLSIQRLKFALKLRNFEALVTYLPSNIWKTEFEKFIDICENFIFSPQRIDTYQKYHPKIVSLCIRAGQYSVAKRLIERIDICWNVIRNSLTMYHGAHEKLKMLERAREHSQRLIAEAIAVGSPLNSLDLLNYDASFYGIYISNYSLRELTLKVFFADLHLIPFKTIFLQPTFRTHLPLNKNNGLFRLQDYLKHTDHFQIQDYSILIDVITGQHDLDIFLPNALYLYTRPFNTLELTSLIKGWCTANSELIKLNSLLSLFNIPPIKVRLSYNDEGEGNIPINIKLETKHHENNPKIALTSFLTEEASWTAHVRGDGKEPDGDRYVRLYRIINEIIKCREKIDYVVFPELSIPRGLITFLANKLKRKGISLIAGIEYDKKNDESIKSFNGKVTNQMLFILNVKNGNYIEQVAIVQDKVIPAYHEETHLFHEGGLYLEAKHPAKYIIQHDKFFFSGLICNELLNIDYRQPLRGNIDALFVVEWNKDIEMYDSIVASTSNDLHCFVVQVNNRKYGDTRIRAPYKENYLRDKVRIRGGDHDYFVVATVDIKSLREFQRHHRSPDDPYKPTPTGFTMSKHRREIDFK